MVEIPQQKTYIAKMRIRCIVWPIYMYGEKIQESPAVADKPARRLRNVCTVYVRAVGL